MITANQLIEKFQYALDNKWGYIWGTAGVKWTQARQDALDQTTDSDRALSRQYGKKWIGHYVADCSGLFTWAFRQLGGTMYHGSNTMYLKWCTDHGELKSGKRTDFATLKPGTAVFHWNGKNYSHVGLFIGGDSVIEAKGTRNGVIKSKVTNSEWTHWGELKGIDYSGEFTQAPVTQDPVTPPTLRKGNKGSDVTTLQNMLVKCGYWLGQWGVDGDFGTATEKAVKLFQADHKDADGKPLVVDGVVGKKTWEALYAATGAEPTEKKYTVHIPGLTKEEADSLVNQYSGFAYKTEE